MVKEAVSPAYTNLRMPPQDLEAEQSVLGALMLDGKAIDVVSDVLRPDDFYRERHRMIYEAMLDRYSASEPIDLLSVASRLEEKKQLDATGGRSYLAELVNGVPSASNVKHYADIVQKKSTLRGLIGASAYLGELGYREEADLDGLLDEAEKKIFAVTRFVKQKFLSVKHALKEAWDRIEKLQHAESGLRGVPSGFTELDNKLAGFQKSDLIILASRPSMGKTALALDIARKAACEHRVPVGIFSHEMSAQQLVDRMLAAGAHIDAWRLRTGKLREEEFTRLSDAMDILSNAPIYITDEPSYNIMQMRAMARRLQAEKGLGLIIVDYLQLLVPRRETESLVQQITEISRSLKSLARELDTPIIALSQLSRAVESRGGRPRLSDLRDSGSIEQDADVVMFIYREDKYKEASDRKNVAEILIEKHRNGPTGSIELYFNADKVTFSSLEKSDFGGL